MSVYPFALDSDETIIRIDDNITELGGDAINQLRDAVFAQQKELGIGLKGSLNTLADRLNISLNGNGTIKQSALAAVGLVTLPIVDNQVAINAGIKEYKLTLDHTTSDLYTLIIANKDLLDAVNAFTSAINTNFLNHLAGSTFLSDGETSARHVASHIDLNSIPSDSRDPFFTWSGLKNKSGILRTASQVATALLQINDDLTNHENAIVNAHVASAINVDTSDFQEIPSTADTVQKVINYIEKAEELNIGEHRAVHHANGIPVVARSQSIIENDGYGQDVVVSTTIVNAYLVNPPANTPTDSNTVGDDIIKFKPTNNTNFIFDSQFSQVKIGDIIRINYGNGVSTFFEIESTRFTPGVEWIVRINGSNLVNAVDGLIDGYAGIATARIDRAQYDSNTTGVLALASANSIPSTLYPNILGSVIVGNPRGATTLGLGFDGNKLNSSHYKLWLQLYPTGNPIDKVINLPFIDVTGDSGMSPGSYTLEKIVHATNNAFRKVGYNYRFIAFEHKGDFGIMLADAIDKASFAIINGSNSTGAIITDIYTQNVVADASDGDALDAFGFGNTATEIASPAYQTSWIDSIAAQHPTKVITPVKRRFYIVDGRKLDLFAPTYLANSDGYWPAIIEAKTSTGSSVEVTYKVNLDLRAAKLKPGKTLVVQPEVLLNSPSYSVNDYGRFIIKQVNFSEPCGNVGAFTNLTVINGVHGNGNAIAFTSDPGLLVRLFFSEDSVGFDDLHIIDGGVSGLNYHRFHEIYVNRNGVTFSHERARMKADQSEAAPPTSLLRSDFWHIKTISSKLRGYRDNTTTFNKYVRFYVTRYDSTCGEFDGYIGRRNISNTSISNIGPITTSRKNIQTRFYDETYVDYVDLEFKELAVGPTGTAILSDTNPRYIDIEIFPTMRLDDENMLIGSCEVNWDPPTGQNIIQTVKDLRDFGSIGPNNLNNSAIDFINAGDRLLHENGIVRGFQYIPSGTINTTGQLFFNGGVALVNGKIVTTNNSSLTIPAISDGGVTGVIVTWAICVNEFGYLQSIILTSVKDQIFPAIGSLYYVPSITFDELINNRKDLTLIATVDAHISSIIINDSDVHDLRRFVAEEGALHSITLTSDNFVGNFYNFDSVKAWVNNLQLTNNQVIIKGNISVSTPVDLTGYDNPVLFKSDGATITITSGKGIIIGSNVTLEDLNFVYNPVVIFSDPLDNVNTGNGCIYADPSTSLKDVKILKCRFTSILSSGTQRPPFINFELNKGDIIEKLTISDCQFKDPSNTYNQSAIAIIGLQNGPSLNPAVIANSSIVGNICNRAQSIIITTIVDVTSPSPPIINEIWHRPGINFIHTSIISNNCGVIGYVASSLKHSQSDLLIDGYALTSGLLIKENTVNLIGLFGPTGYMGGSGAFQLAFIQYGTGNVVISDNFVHWIQVGVSNNDTNHEYSSLSIINNKCTAHNSSYLAGYNSTINAAINIIGNSSADENSNIQVFNNNIQQGFADGVVYRYSYGILTTSGGSIRNNYVSGIDTGGYGIVITPIAGLFNIYNISNNTIVRDPSKTITAFIYNAGSALPIYSYATITDNYLSSPFINSGNTDTNTIKNAAANWVLLRNKNQTVTQVLHARDGVWSINDNILGGTTTSVINQIFSSVSSIEYRYNEVGTDEFAMLRIPLLNILPYYVNVIGFSVTISHSSATSTVHVLTLSVLDSDSFFDTLSQDITNSSTTIDLVMTRDHLSRPTTNVGGIPEASLRIEVNDTNPNIVSLSSITINYRW